MVFFGLKWFLKWNGVYIGGQEHAKTFSDAPYKNERVALKKCDQDMYRGMQ